MKFGLTTDEMSSLEFSLRVIERLDKKYRVVNVSNNKHKCCHEISVLWKNRIPFWPELSAISFSKDPREFEGIAVLSSRVYQIGLRLDCHHYLEKIDSYQIKCINEAGLLCYGLMSPHSDYGHRFCRSEAVQRETKRNVYTMRIFMSIIFVLTFVDDLRMQTATKQQLYKGRICYTLINRL